MKQLLVNGSLGPCIEQVEMPIISERQVLVKNLHSLVSTGTERHYVEQCQVSDRRLRLGYCGVGEVVATGALVEHVHVGQLVIAMGWEYAVHAEYLVMPMRLVQPIPPGMACERALFANIMATAVHATDRASLLVSDHVLVIGAGLVGQMVAEVSRQTASSVLLTDIDAVKATSNPNIQGIESWQLLAKRHLYQGEFTKAFICISGQADEWLDALPGLLNPRGNGLHRPRIIGVGRYKAQVSFSVDLGNIDLMYSARCGEGYRNDDYVHGILDIEPLPGEATVDKNLQRSLEVLQRSDIALEQLISRRLTLSQLPALYNELKQPNSMLSVIVDYQ